MMAVWKMGPALAAGNLQILKPSEQTPLSLLRFVQLAQDVIPPGVLQVVTGDGVPVGQRIVEHPDVGMVSITGDVETGKIVARTAADTVKRVHLELGGKAPMVIFDDADPKAVAEGIRLAGYWNSGQDCTAGSRVIAGPKIYDALLSELIPQVESLKVGDPLFRTRPRWARSSHTTSRSGSSASSSGQKGARSSRAAGRTAARATSSSRRS